MEEFKSDNYSYYKFRKVLTKWGAKEKEERFVPKIFKNWGAPILNSLNNRFFYFFFRDLRLLNKVPYEVDELIFKGQKKGKIFFKSYQKTK